MGTSAVGGGQRGEIFLIYTLTIVDSAGSTMNTAKIRKKLCIMSVH